MKKRFITVTILAIALLISLVCINSTAMLEVDIPMTLHIISKETHYVGSGSLDSDGVTLALSRWPNYGIDQHNIKLQLSSKENGQLNSEVEFELTVKLNDLTKTIPISGLIHAGIYHGSITCCFNNLKSGYYTLSIYLNVKGSTSMESICERTLSIP